MLALKKSFHVWRRQVHSETCEAIVNELEIDLNRPASMRFWFEQWLQHLDFLTCQRISNSLRSWIQNGEAHREIEEMYDDLIDGKALLV